MIFGIGTDIVSIHRIKSVLERTGERFARRILADNEWAEFHQHVYPERLLAKRFAAKEAMAKAMGLGIGRGLNFREIAVIHDALGKPELICLGESLETFNKAGIDRSYLSISDEQDYAVAFVVLWKREFDVIKT